MCTRFCLKDMMNSFSTEKNTRTNNGHNFFWKSITHPFYPRPIQALKMNLTKKEHETKRKLFLSVPRQVTNKFPFYSFNRHANVLFKKSNQANSFFFDAEKKTICLCLSHFPLLLVPCHLFCLAQCAIPAIKRLFCAFVSHRI